MTVKDAANQETEIKTAAEAGAPRSTASRAHHTPRSRSRQPARANKGTANSRGSTAATDAGPATTLARAKKTAGTGAGYTTTPTTTSYQ